MNREEKTTLNLAATICIETAAQFYQELLTLLETNRPVVLNGSAVESVDTAGLQLLTAFCLELDAREVGYQWQATSEPLVLSAHNAGLSAALQLPCSR